jgi:N-acetyl-gamma-glutamyl-phosphate reductase
MASVFIDGEAGTTGLGIRDRLAGEPIKIRAIDPALRKNPAARQALMAEVDILILCLPDDAAREAVALAAALGDRAPRILDASTAHRTDPAWTYGFPEFAHNQPALIAAARLVANPGCYATGAIAILAPLVAAGLIPADFPLSLNAVSGFSGGGRAMIEAHEAEGGPAFELYALDLAHKHLPEIARFAGLSRPPLFVPSVGHFAQGMLVNLPLHLQALPGQPAATDLYQALATHYQGSAAIHLHPPEPGAHLDPQALNGTNNLEIFIHTDKTGRLALLTARLDNLGKGASGAAVQNLRLMLGMGGANG